VDHTNVPKIRKPKSRIKKSRGNDIKWSNLCENQATHFASYLKSLNADNSSYNCKNIRSTYDVRPIICVSFAKEGKENTNMVGYYCRANSTKVSQSKQHSSQ